MRRLFPRVHGGFSTITLLGASTILLAVAGETLWHASAVAGVRRAAPTTGVAPAVLLATSASAAKGTSAMFTGEPVFKPFVYVELPLPEDCTLVEDAGLHMNNDGVVVATMSYQSNNYGFIWRDENYASGWQGPLNDGTSDIVLDDAGLTGINDGLEICGVEDDSGPVAFYYELTDGIEGTLIEIGNGYAQDINEEGVVVGMSTGGTPVGWTTTSTNPVPLHPLVQGGGTAALGVTPGTLFEHSLIVGQSHDESSFVEAVLWYYDSDWTPVQLSDVDSSAYSGIALDVNEDGVVIGGILHNGAIDDTAMWYYDEVGDAWTGVSLDVDPVFFPEAINDQEYPEVVGDKYLWVSSSVSAGSGTQIDLSEMSLGLPSNMLHMRCTDINDSGEIVGVGQLGSEGAWVAFKLVPYDVNNNGESDVREIVASDFDLDSNGNWLIDWAETDTANTPSGMRLGLHGPGNIAVDGKIDPVQIVRLKVNVAPHGGLHPDGPEEGEDFFVDEIVSSTPECEACQDFTNLIDDWGTGDARPSPLTGEQCEILVRVHSMMGDDETFGNNEGLPENQTARDQALEDLEIFGYRFAHCVDYVQWGNESFSASSGYMFRDDELQSTGCSWTGDPKKFDELDDSTTGYTCRQEAIGLVLDWQEEMMWATLRGSALAGRPLRMVTTGIINKNVRNGYDAGNAQDPPSHFGYIGYVLTDTVTSWANENQMYFSMHTHYFTVAEAIEAIQKLVDTYNGAGAPWDVPNWRISTEVGTKADFDDDGWWDELFQSRANRQIHNEFFKVNGNPGELWEDFIGRWEDFSDNFGDVGDPGFRLDDVLVEFADAGFAAVCWSCLQFGSHTEQNPSPFYVEGLRADKLTSDSFTDEPDRFTPLKAAYVTHGAAYYIDDLIFTPHSCACSAANTCPGCP